MKIKVFCIPSTWMYSDHSVFLVPSYAAKDISGREERRRAKEQGEGREREKKRGEEWRRRDTYKRLRSC